MTPTIRISSAGQLVLRETLEKIGGGYFTVGVPGPGPYDMVLEVPGYLSAEKKGVTVDEEKPTAVEFTLKRE